MNKLAIAAFLSPALLFCAEETLPKAETILDRSLEVTGGKAAFEKHRTRVQQGTVEFVGRGVKGTVTTYEADPNKSLLVIELEGVGKIESGTNGEVAWENSALQGPRIKQGIEKTDALRDSTFNAGLQWRKLYVKAETAGAETVEGHDCYKVVLTPKEGQPTTDYFDKKSGLLIKSTAKRTSPMGEIAAEILFDDYRKDGDILSPHLVVERFAGLEVKRQVTKVEYNVDLPSNRFDLPAEIQALLKKSDQSAVKLAVAAPAANGADGGKLTIYMSGKAFATEKYSFQKADGKIELTGSGNAAIGPMKVDIDQFRVVTDEKYQLLEATAKAKLGQVQMNVKTTFAEGKAKSQIDTGQGPQAKEDEVHAGAVVVNQNLPLYPWSFLVMRAEMKNQEPQEFPVYVLGQSEVTATVVFKGRESVEFAGKTADLNHLNVSGKTPQGQPITLDFWVDDNRKVIKLAVPAQGVEGYQEGYDRKAPPEAPKPEPPKSDSKGADRR